jgi:hypothetical protein
MKQVVAKKEQSLTDVVIQHYGSIEAMIELLRDNGFDMSKSFEISETISVNESLSFKPEVVNYYNRKKTDIATVSSNDNFSGIFDDTFDDTFE